MRHHAENLRRGYDALTAGRFVRRAAFAGFTGAGVDDAESTTRGDENVRTPCASKSITVWYSFMLLTVPSPYCACATRSPGVYFSMSSPRRVERCRREPTRGAQEVRRYTTFELWRESTAGVRRRRLRKQKRDVHQVYGDEVPERNRDGIRTGRVEPDRKSRRNC